LSFQAVLGSRRAWSMVSVRWMSMVCNALPWVSWRCGTWCSSLGTAPQLPGFSPRSSTRQ